MDEFNVDADYEGGQFIGDEFFFTNKRKKRRFTKDDAIYGIFNEEQRDSGPLYTRSVGVGVAFEPVRFEKSSQKLDEEVTERREKEVAKAAGAHEAESSDDESDDSDDAYASLPTSFGSGRRRMNREGASEASQPTTPVGWDTKGAVSRMMSLMGYSGGGLGKKGEGISEPIKVQLRPKNAALGSIREMKQKTLVELNAENAKEARALQKKEKARRKSRRGAWKKNLVGEEESLGEGSGRVSGRGRRARSMYKLPEELVAESGPLSDGDEGIEGLDELDAEARRLTVESNRAPTTNVLDMRGPHARVLTSMEELGAFSGATVGGSGAEDIDIELSVLPELQYNLRTLVTLSATQAKQDEVKGKRFAENRRRIASRRAGLQRSMRADQANIKRLERLMEIVSRVNTNVRSGTLDYPISVVCLRC